MVNIITVVLAILLICLVYLFLTSGKNNNNTRESFADILDEVLSTLKTQSYASTASASFVQQVGIVTSKVSGATVTSAVDQALKFKQITNSAIMQQIDTGLKQVMNKQYDYTASNFPVESHDAALKAALSAALLSDATTVSIVNAAKAAAITADKYVAEIVKLVNKGDKGPKGDAGPPGLPGRPGDQGDKGVVGDAATMDLLGITITKKDGQTISAMTLPKQLCLGDGTCIGESDMNLIKKKWTKCNVSLWDAPLNYRIYSTIWPYTNGTDATNWFNVRNSNKAWADSRLASRYGWHPSVNSPTGYDGNWMIINTEPMLSQKVKGYRCLPRADENGNNTQYLTSIYLMHMPLAPNSVEIPCEAGDNPTYGKLYDFNNNAARSGFEVFFAKEVECKYIRVVYNTYSITPANRCGLYICI